MARVVCIHGIAQHLESRESLLAEWRPSLLGGVSNAGGLLDESDVDMAFYGILFRPAGGKGSDGAESGEISIPAYKPGDVDDPVEQQLLEEMYEAASDGAAAADGTKASPAPRIRNRMLQVVSAIPYFGKKSQSLVIWFLKQVRRYLNDPEVRKAAQRALTERVREDTRVIVAHSLGTLVAYEVLAAGLAPKVHTLITLGSPLGTPAIRPRLKPPTIPGETVAPSCLQSWVNIADAADIVALKKDLRPIYGDRVTDHRVHNGATMHDVRPYLTARETGAAIIEGLRR